MDDNQPEKAPAQTGGQPESPESAKQPSLQQSYSQDHFALVRVNTPEDLDNELAPKKDEDEGMLGDIFNIRKPRDIANGMSHAAQNVGRGVAIGVGGLISAPISGAQSEGITGFFKGLGIGVTGAVVAPAVGIGTGISQMVRGVMAQASANDAKSKGLVWDASKRDWVPEKKITLEELLVDAKKKLTLEQKREQGNLQSGSSVSGPVKETELYDILGIEPGPQTTTIDIKKAYYKKAKENHPDKNRGDPDADQKFKNISEAYQILSDPKTRNLYDKNGRKACEQSPMMDFDPGFLFGMIFGSETLSPFIGEEFKISAILTQVLTGGLDMPDERTFDGLMSTSLDCKQQVRVLKMAVHLRTIIAPAVSVELYTYLERKARKHPEKWRAAFELVSSNKPPTNILPDWIKSMEKLASDLCKGTFGRLYVESLGFAYKTSATEYRDSANILESASNKISDSFKSVSSTWALFQRFLSLLQGLQEAQYLQDKLDRAIEMNDKDQMTAISRKLADRSKELMNKALDFGLRINLMDVHSSVHEAVTLCVTKDTSVPKYERRIRADVIHMLGGIFTRVARGAKYYGDDDGASIADVEKHLEEAIRKAMQRKEADEYGEKSPQ